MEKGSKSEIVRFAKLQQWMKTARPDPLLRLWMEEVPKNRWRTGQTFPFYVWRLLENLDNNIKSATPVPDTKENQVIQRSLYWPNLIRNHCCFEQKPHLTVWNASGCLENDHMITKYMLSAVTSLRDAKPPVFTALAHTRREPTSLPLVHSSPQSININPHGDKRRWLSALCGVCNTTQWFTTASLEADSCRAWIITQQFSLTTFIHELNRHLSRGTSHTHTRQRLNLLLQNSVYVLCVRAARWRKSLLSLPLSLYFPLVLDLPSVSSPLSFILPHLFYLPLVILLSHSALRSSLQSQLFLCPHSWPVSSPDGIAPPGVIQAPKTPAPCVCLITQPPMQKQISEPKAELLSLSRKH